MKYSDKVKHRIETMALEIAPDYPNIKDTNELEQLYAIDQAYRAAKAACSDWHIVVKTLMKNYQIPRSEIDFITDEIYRLGL